MHSFHLRTDTRALITQIARAYGISANIDPQVQARPLRFDVGSTDFATAMRLAGAMSKTFWVPLTAKSMLVLNDDPPTRQAFEKFALTESTKGAISVEGTYRTEQKASLSAKFRLKKGDVSLEIVPGSGAGRVRIGQLRESGQQLVMPRWRRNDDL